MRNETAEIKIGGMICRACSDAVEDALMHTRGVVSAKVDYWKAAAHVKYDPDIVTPEGLSKSVEAIGYTTGGGLGGIWVDIICAALIAVTVWLLRKGIPIQVPKAQEGMSLAYIFLIGLLTGTHCIGMCGGIILSQTTDASNLGTQKKKNRKGVLQAALSYNGGRVISYTVMGAIFGAVGTVISYTMKTKSVVFMLAGLVVAIIGVQMWGVLPGLRRLSPQQNSLCSLPLKARRAFVDKPMLVGLLTGLMPCGALYAMWVYAMSSGSFLGGGAVMLAFSLGTVPALFLFGVLNSFIPAKWTKYMLKISAVLVCAMGISMLVKGITMSGIFGA